MSEQKEQNTLTQNSTIKRPFVKKPKSIFEELLKSDISPNLPKVGEIIIGTVIAKRGSRLYINLGALKTGLVYGAEFYNARGIIKKLETGQEITAKVVGLETDEGYIELSLTGSMQDLSWKKLIELKEAKEVIAVKIESANKGGLIATVQDQQAFLPVSQLATEHYPRVEDGDKEKILDELKKLVDKELKVRVIDAEPTEDKLIISEKEAQNEKLQELLNQYKVGDVIEGEISGVVDFGAFVKFKPPSSEKTDMDVEGLVHISELDWQLIEHPRDVVKTGQKVKAKIISIDNGKMSLSLKALKQNPWEKVLEKYKPGQTVKGFLMKLNHFGAFIRLDEEIHGLVHISEFGTEEKMRQALEPDKAYSFKIISIEPSEYRMALALIKKEEEEPLQDKVRATSEANSQEEDKKENSEENLT
jgi:small subunit ribosomal protein S1